MKVAIVTGGSSGIGAATARLLAGRGWRVAVNYSKNKAQAEKVVMDCGEAIAVQGNVAEDADCRRLAGETLKKWGRIDALVNNAGTTKPVKHADLEGLRAEDFERIFRVNVSSVAALLGTGSSVAYAASKAALDTMTFSLARTLAPEVRVNLVAPGYVSTPWQVAAHGEQGAQALEERFASIAPLRSACSAEDVADAIAWLLEGARRVTGERIYVDSGIHIASLR
jgi:3-oxoacyl-[acyl-carrier protein] reductase